MYCPFLKTDCYSKCAFRHIPRQASGGLQNTPNTCILEEIEVGGNSEEDCMERLAAFEEKHGEMTWYSGVSDEDYANGEYIGRDNFIYD